MWDSVPPLPCISIWMWNRLKETTTTEILVPGSHHRVRKHTFAWRTVHSPPWQMTGISASLAHLDKLINTHKPSLFISSSHTFKLSQGRRCCRPSSLWITTQIAHTYLVRLYHEWTNAHTYAQEQLHAALYKGFNQTKGLSWKTNSRKRRNGNKCDVQRRTDRATPHPQEVWSNLGGAAVDWKDTRVKN